VRTGVSIGDTLAAMHGASGCHGALPSHGQWRQGQQIDVALHEAVFNVMET